MRILEALEPLILMALSTDLRRYTSPQLLCVDEVGHLSYNSRYADVLFELVTDATPPANRSCSAQTRPFSGWSEIFRHPARVGAPVEDLIHRAEIIDIEVDSYPSKVAKVLTGAGIKEGPGSRPS